MFRSQSNFQGTQISKTLRILPPWSTIEDPRIKNVIIKPGTGFGTGTHPTTKLCLDCQICPLKILLMPYLPIHHLDYSKVD